jgi:hypothetical protein
MQINNMYEADIGVILAKRHELGGDYWESIDGRLMKGSPFTTLDCALMLSDLGVDREDPVLRSTAELILGKQREDGRFRLSPDGAIYPCQTINAIRTLCHLGYAADNRLKVTWEYLMGTQYKDGGWRCNKFSFGHGPETEFSNPGPTLTALDAFRFTPFLNREEGLSKATDFLLDHWTVRSPIGPCHYGIGSLFMQVTYPFSSYNLFFYTYVLSFYDRAKADPRFMEALACLQAKLVDGRVKVERQNPGLKALSAYKKGEISPIGTQKYLEILQNLGQG